MDIKNKIEDLQKKEEKYFYKGNRGDKAIRYFTRDKRRAETQFTNLIDFTIRNYKDTNNDLIIFYDIVILRNYLQTQLRRLEDIKERAD